MSIDARTADLALVHGCGGLAYRAADRDSSDPASVDRLHDTYRWNALQARRQRLGLAEVSRVLTSAGIESTVGKGLAVVRHYPGPGLRPPGDIDLYVPREQGGEASSVLASGATNVPVDLHKGFADLDDRDIEEMRRRFVNLTVEGEAVQTFGFEDHLRLLSIHAARHGVIRAMWLCDIALLLESIPEGFDPAWFAEGDPQRTDVAFRVLGLAHTLLGASLDRFPADRSRLLPPPWMEDAVLAEWGRARLSHGSRRPWRTEMFRPWRWPQAALNRWPNAFEAAYATRTPINDGGSVFTQLRACARRVQQFRAGLREASHPKAA